MTLTATQPASATWSEVRQLLRMELPPRLFDDYVGPCVGHQWFGDELVVAAASSFAVSWLTIPMHQEMADEALARVVGPTARILYRAMPQVVLSAPAAVAEDPVPAVEDEANPDHCPDHPEQYLRWRTRWGSLKRMERKWEDEIYFCSGDDRDCTWVYSRDLGVIVAQGAAAPNTYESVLVAYKHKRADGRA